MDNKKFFCNIRLVIGICIAIGFILTSPIQTLADDIVVRSDNVATTSIPTLDTSSANFSDEPPMSDGDDISLDEKAKIGKEKIISSWNAFKISFIVSFSVVFVGGMLYYIVKGYIEMVNNNTNNKPLNREQRRKIKKK